MRCPWCVCSIFRSSNMKITIETNQRNRLKDRRHPSQGRDSVVSGLCESTVKWLSTRVGNTCIQRLCTYIDTGTHADTYTSRPIHHQTQIRLPSDLLILIVMLVTSMSPNFCSGACTNEHPNLALTREPCGIQ